MYQSFKCFFLSFTLLLGPLFVWAEDNGCNYLEDLRIAGTEQEEVIESFHRFRNVISSLDEDIQRRLKGTDTTSLNELLKVATTLKEDLGIAKNERNLEGWITAGATFGELVLLTTIVREMKRKIPDAGKRRRFYGNKAFLIGTALTSATLTFVLGKRIIKLNDRIDQFKESIKILNQITQDDGELDQLEQSLESPEKYRIKEEKLAKLFIEHEIVDRDPASTRPDKNCKPLVTGEDFDEALLEIYDEFMSIYESE